MNARSVIFRREPAVIVGFIEALVAILASQWLDWTNEQVALTVAAFAAVLNVYVAIVTHDTLLGFAVGAVKALAALAIGFGMEITEEQTGLLLALITTGLALYQRPQTSPIGYEGTTEGPAGPFDGDASPDLPVDETITKTGQRVSATEPDARGGFTYGGGAGPGGGGGVHRVFPDDDPVV